MAAQAMFTISFSYADCLRDGWKPLLDYVAKLHKIQALPAALLEKDDFVDLQGVCVCETQAGRQAGRQKDRDRETERQTERDRERESLEYVWEGEGVVRGLVEGRKGVLDQREVWCMLCAACGG